MVRRGLVAIMVLQVLAGCGGGTVSLEGDVAFDVVDSNHDLARGLDASVETVTDIVLPEEVEEVTSPDVVDFDLLPDIAQGGEFGDPCDAHDDCLSGICYPSLEGDICGSICASGDCPAEWACMFALWWEDGMESICVPPEPHALCQPCETSEDCGSSPEFEVRCFKYGVPGNFCASSCAADIECPGGYECED